MRSLHNADAICASVCITLLLTGAGMVRVTYAGKNTEALAADHVIACIRTAVAAQPGLVKEVEAEYEQGQWLCEVKVVDEAGKRHKLHIDVATNQVVKVKAR